MIAGGFGEAILPPCERPAKVEDLLWCLESSPHRLTIDALRRRLAIVNADGQCVDGEASRHYASQMLPLLWDKLERIPRDAWDAFHRINIKI